MNLQRVFSVLPTPFSPSGDLDFASLRKVVDLYIRAGVHGLTALADAAVRASGPPLDTTTSGQLDRQLKWVWQTGGIEWT